MARTKRASGVRVVGGGGRAAAPIVVVPPSTPAAPRRRSSSKRRSRSSGKRRHKFAVKHSLQTSMMALGAGGAIIGFVEKHFGAQIPTLPIVGRKGAMALAVLFLKPKSMWLQDAGKAAAAIAGYELGTTGKVTGIDGAGGRFM